MLSPWSMFNLTEWATPLASTGPRRAGFGVDWPRCSATKLRCGKQEFVIIKLVCRFQLLMRLMLWTSNNFLVEPS